MQAKVLTVASAKGGTGKSTVAVFAGQALAQQGKRVLLLELAEQLRNVDCIAGIEQQVVFDISDWLAGRCTAERAMVKSPRCDNFFIMPAPYVYSPLELRALKECLQPLLQQFDFILFDTPTGIQPCFCEACRISEQVLLVLTDDVLALRSGRAATEWIGANSKANVRLVLNQAFRTGDKIDLDECIDTVAAQLLAVIPYSKHVLRSFAQEHPLSEKTEVWKASENLAARLCGQEVPLLFS